MGNKNCQRHTRIVGKGRVKFLFREKKNPKPEERDETKSDELSIGRNIGPHPTNEFLASLTFGPTVAKEGPWANFQVKELVAGLSPSDNRISV